MSKRVWGVMGKMAAGKDAVTDYLQELGWHEIGMGDLVRELATERGLEHSRDNLDMVQEEYTSQFGRGYFAKLAAERAIESEYDNVVINGLRRPEDVDEIQGAYEDIFLVGVDADDHVRYERMKDRGRVGDPESFEDFLEMDANQERLFGIDESFSRAHYVINNNGTYDELKEEIDVLLEAEPLSV